MRRAPWNEKTVLPWPAIKVEWEQFWDLNKPILLEKSPPHLLRAKAIEQNFENTHFIVMIRNPFAYCEGTRRRRRVGLGYGRDASYTQIANGWLRESQHQLQNLQQLERVMLLTYEALTDDPAEAAAQVLAFMPDLETLDYAAVFLIHSLAGWVDRPLTNLNETQIARLSAEDIGEINGVLKNKPDLMAYFGYELMTGAYSPAARTRLALSTFFTKYITRSFQRIVRKSRRFNNDSRSQ